MSQSLASHVRKLGLPPSPAVLQYANKEKAKVWELDLMEHGQATALKLSEWQLWAFMGGGVWIRAALHGK